jgi:hypothetical protein
VQQEQVDVVGPEAAQRVLRGAAQLVGLEVAREDLRRQPDVLAVDAALRDRLADLVLVLVRARRVDVPIADLERVAHALLGVAVVHQPGPEPERRHARPLHLDHRLIACAHPPDGARTIATLRLLPGD